MRIIGKEREGIKEKGKEEVEKRREDERKEE